MTRWEYRNASTSSARPFLSEPELDTFGKDGWQLVSVAGRGPNTGLLYVFKRPVLASLRESST